MNNRVDDPSADRNLLLEEIRQLRQEQAATHRVLVAIHDLLDDFCRVYLSSRFRFGKPVDRFARPRG